MKKKNKLFSDLEAQYNEQANRRKDKIRQEPNKFKRFWKWVWYYLTFGFVWVFYNIRDWKTFVIYAIVNVVVSSEVWIPYVIGVFCWNNEPLRNSMFAFGSACFLFWLGPGTPFMIICIGITIIIKGIFNKIKNKKNKKKDEIKQDENTEAK